MIDLPAFGPAADEMWTALLDIADAVPQDWAVIGAQMVLLHALERGVQPPRFSGDVDVLVNARVVSGRIAAFVQQIVQLGFELEGWSAEGIAHRYVRGAASVDVLAPEGLASKSSLVTTPPGRTIQVPGGTQALHRAEAVEVRFAGRPATIHRPSLLGAIIAKSCAVDVDDAPANQRIDLALLLTMIEEPFELATQLTAKDRQRLRKRRELLDTTHDAWRGIARAADGVAALRVLTDRDT